MNETVKLGLTLFLITAISAFILSMSNNITEPVIAEANLIKDQEAKKELISDADNFKEADQDLLNKVNSLDEEILEVYQAEKNEEIIGYTFKALTKGYGGNIEFIVAISTNGEVSGLKILNHSETPGLGENITKDYFYESFEDKAINSELIAVESPSGENEVQALTSATMTTDAVVDKVNEIIDVYKQVLVD